MNCQCGRPLFDQSRHFTGVQAELTLTAFTDGRKDPPRTYGQQVEMCERCAELASLALHESFREFTHLVAEMTNRETKGQTDDENISYSEFRRRLGAMLDRAGQHDRRRWPWCRDTARTT